MTSAVAVPSTPLQDRLKTLSEVKPFIVREPITALLPDQLSEEVQLVTSELSQVRVTFPLKATFSSLLVSVTCGPVVFGRVSDMEFSGISTADPQPAIKNIRKKQTSSLFAIPPDLVKAEIIIPPGQIKTVHTGCTDLV